MASEKPKQYLVAVERDGRTDLVWMDSDPFQVDEETSLADTAVDAARKAWAGAFCYLRLDNQGKKVSR